MILNKPVHTPLYTINCKGKLLALDRAKVMGIINVTPDSFYENSRFNGMDAILEEAAQMLQKGAAIIDIGGQSTRPGSESVGASAELDRVIPAIETIAKAFPDAIISVDTYHAAVAKAAVEAGAVMVNDISGGTIDATMLATVANLRVPYICMHIKGTPANMQQQAVYKNVTQEVLDFFIQRTEACRQAGINDVIIDPGFGFGKTIAHNFQLLRELSLFHMLQRPVLLGISRKSTIYKTLGITAAEALNGTTALHTIGLLNGAHILRVHDVKEAVETIQLLEACYTLPSSGTP
jgi:dihydropteroate synthase